MRVAIAACCYQPAHNTDINVLLVKGKMNDAKWCGFDLQVEGGIGVQISIDRVDPGLVTH